MKIFKSINLSLLFLISVTLLSLLIRIYKIDQVYSTLNRDEAALAYNAYLLKTTGRDEWGQAIAPTLLSFGDWKLIGYPALLIGLYQYLPLTDWTVRLPSILMGTALIPLTYYLVLKLSRRRLTAILAATFIATTPIFFFYSRMAYEANVALFYVVSAICLFFFSQHSRFELIKNLVAAGLMLLAGLTYNTPVFILPIILICLILNRGLINIRAWMKPVGMMMLALLMIVILTRTVLQNKTGVTIFSDETTTLARNDYYTQFPPPLRPIFGNQYVYDLILITRSLGQTISYNFLVKNGGSHPWHQLPGWGHITPISYILFLIALGYFFYAKKSKIHFLSSFKSGLGIHASLALLGGLSLLPAAVTVDAPHATRSLLFIYLIIVLGISMLSKHLKFVIGLILVLAQVTYFGLYLQSYFQLDDRNIGELRPGFAQIIRQVNFNENDQVAIVADGYQYILLAWYLKVPPHYYLTHNRRGLSSLYGLRYGEKVGQFHFIAAASDRSLDEKYIIWYDNQAKLWRLE